MGLMPRLLASLSALLLSGCVTLAPEAERVQVLEKGADTSACKLLGEVTAPPPFVGPRDYLNKLKNRVAAAGGNALFVTSAAIGPATGMAYACPD